MRIGINRQHQAVSHDNAGLLLDKGLESWDLDSSKQGQIITQHLHNVAALPVPEIYTLAYKRWVVATSTEATQDNSSHYFAKLDGRLYTGIGMPHILEAAITQHAIYGVPFIPGSSIKGLVRATAETYGIEGAAADILFGSLYTESASNQDSKAGYLIFHDAWWHPKENTYPLVAEVITEHSRYYYQEQNDTPIDLQSPNPHPQIAAQGTFYFVIEGAQSWAELGMKILKQALEDNGIGAKVNSGYGYFSQTDTQAKQEAGEWSSPIFESKEKEWLDYTCDLIAKKNHIPPNQKNDIVFQKTLAQAWAEIEDREIKQSIKTFIQQKWGEALWENPGTKSRKAAKAIYEQ